MALFRLDTAGDQQLLTTNILNTERVLLPSNKSGLLEENLKPKDLLASSITKAEDADHDDEDESEDEADDGDYFGLPPPSVDLSNIINKTLQSTQRSSTHVELQLDKVGSLVDETVAKAQAHPHSRRKKVCDLDHSDMNVQTGRHDDEQMVATDVDKLMAQTVQGLEQCKKLARPDAKHRKMENKRERAKSKGKNWYNLPATELTEEVKNDLKILQMRSVLDPKHFYKKNDLKVLPKYFQIGTVQHSPLDYYSERDTRRNKKKSMLDELMNDESALSYTKRKFKEITAKRDKYAHRKAMKKMKKLKKNK